MTHSNDFEELDSDDSELDDELATVANYLIQGEHSKDHESSTSSEESDGPTSYNNDGEVMQTLPLTTQVGKITGIRIYTDAQLAIRQHKWKKKISGRAKGDACLPMKKNLVNYALRTAWNMQLNGTTQSDITQNSLENFSPFVSENFTVPLHFSKGWARRPKNGQMYGPKHVLIYRPDILEMFKLGEEDKKKQTKPSSNTGNVGSQISTRILSSVRK